MSKETISQNIIDFAATRSDKVVMNPRNGYYPFEIIAEAFNKGEEKAEEEIIEKLRGKFIEKANLTNKAISKVLKRFKKEGFTPRKIFVDISMDNSKVLISVKEKIYVTDNFLDKAHSFVSNLKSISFDNGLNLGLGFLNDDKKIDLNQLKCDGFEIGFDIQTSTTLY